MCLKLAIVGRPNVGKSTLFNRLVKKKKAIVADFPGVTRDRKESDASIGDLKFKVVDTAGFEFLPSNSLEKKMKEQTEKALLDADVIVFMIDARLGLLSEDIEFANYLRKINKDIILIANKCEGRLSFQSGSAEAFKLGFGAPILLSAEHGDGINQLYESLFLFNKKIQHDNSRLSKEKKDTEIERDTEIRKNENVINDKITLAVVGRPNAGKSTLINSLIKKDRLIVGEEAGITRDSIIINHSYNNVDFVLTDTAGLRKKKTITKNVESMSASETIRTIKFAKIVVLVIDMSLGLEKQDLNIANIVLNEGRALIIAANKWDLISEKEEVFQKLKDKLSRSLPQVKGIKIVKISALRGKGVDNITKRAIEINKLWGIRLNTSSLNKWLSFTTESHPPPLISGRRIKLKYITQIKTRPPTFYLSTSLPDKLPESYTSYLINSLRNDFDIFGIPIRILLRKPNNPYAN